MGMDHSAIDKAAAILLDARCTNRQISALPDDCCPQTVEEGYAVQEQLLKLLNDPGDGWLIGLTNPYMQRIFGATEPYYARLLSTGHAKSPQRLHAADFCTIGIECEVAFTMKSDLPPCGREHIPSEVADAVASAHPSIEIVNAHYVDWLHAPLPSIVADNGVDGLLVVGAGRDDWRELDLASSTVSLTIDGVEAAKGEGRRAMGGPVEALTWLANALNQRGWGLRKGELVNTGTCTELRFAAAGETAVASFGGLGEASVDFV